MPRSRRRTVTGPAARPTERPAARAAWRRRSAAGSPATGGSGSTSTCAAAPTSSATSGRRPSRSRAARSGRTAGSRRRSAGRRPSGPWARRSATIRSRSSSRAIAWSGRDGTIGQYSLGGPANKRAILRLRGPRSRPDWRRMARRGDPIRRIRHDPHRLPADLPRRQADHASRTACRSGPWPPRSPAGTARAGRAGPGPVPGSRPDVTTRRTSTVGVVDSTDLGPTTYANGTDRLSRRDRRSGSGCSSCTSSGARPTSASRSRSTRSRRSSWPRSGSSSPAASCSAGRSRGTDDRSPGRPAASGATARSSERCCSVAGWGWSPGASRPSRRASRRC